MISRYSFIVTISRVALTFHAFTFIYSQNVSITGSVINPANKSWGIGQVQSIINEKITVNFENAGKKVINSKNIILEKFVSDE